MKWYIQNLQVYGYVRMCVRFYAQILSMIANEDKNIIKSSYILDAIFIHTHVRTRMKHKTFINTIIIIISLVHTYTCTYVHTYTVECLYCGHRWAKKMCLVSSFQRLKVYYWDLRNCPDWRGVFISEVSFKRVSTVQVFMHSS